jgi:hypothetical protein
MPATLLSHSAPVQTIPASLLPYPSLTPDETQPRPWFATGIDDQALSDAAADAAYEQWLAGTGELFTEDVPCACCGGRADVIPIVDSDLAVCRACVAQHLDGRGADVAAYLDRQDLSPVPCPQCGWHHTCRTVGQLATHLQRVHKLSDDHAVAVVVNAVEFRAEPAAA